MDLARGYFLCKTQVRFIWVLARQRTRRRSIPIDRVLVFMGGFQRFLTNPFWSDMLALYPAAVLNINMFQCRAVGREDLCDGVDGVVAHSEHARQS